MFLRRSGKEAGDNAEANAQHYLQQQGLIAIERNFHSRYGEIDLVMRDRQYLVFVEVRYRKHGRFGSGADTITPHKQRKIILTANHYLQKHYRNAPPPCRFDVISITGNEQENIEWIKDAFQPTL